MKVELTEAARADLDNILAYTSDHFPFQLAALERRFRAVFARIGEARVVRGPSSKIPTCGWFR
jgi:plasmid stabilization system protein ParE